MINGKTKLIGVLGWPVGHSLSPAIHNAALNELGIDCAYLPLQVSPECLAAAISGLKALGFIGFNVTIPYKVRIIPYLDEIERGAALIGAVNTVVNDDGCLVGYNTDADGFINSLKYHNVEVDSSKVAILGAGGAARAVVYGLFSHGAKQIVIGARDNGKAIDFSGSFNSIRISGMGWQDSAFTEWLAEADIIINATPLGMYPNINSMPPLNWQVVNKQAIVCDIVYNPYNTKFLNVARQHGHKIITGEGMLVEQAALALELWTGKVAPRQTMYKIIQKLLNSSIK